jgi:hypothetical protein
MYIRSIAKLLHFSKMNRKIAIVSGINVGRKT